jgi:hypothetical protein
MVGNLHLMTLNDIPTSTTGAYYSSSILQGILRTEPINNICPLLGGTSLKASYASFVHVAVKIVGRQLQDALLKSCISKTDPTVLDLDQVRDGQALEPPQCIPGGDFMQRFEIVLKAIAR